MELISYTLTEIALAGIGLLSFIEVIRQENTSETIEPNVVTALEVETAVNFIAAYIYTQITKEYKLNPNSPLILKLRYADWIFTTPLLLLSLALYLTRTDGNLSVSYGYMVAAAILAIVMCIIGYVAEGKRSRYMASLAFVFLILAFSCIWNFIQDNCDASDYWVFFIVALIWLSYGIAWFIPKVHTRSIAYNYLDMLSKVGFGFFLWFYARNV